MVQGRRSTCCSLERSQPLPEVPGQPEFGMLSHVFLEALGCDVVLVDVLPGSKSRGDQAEVEVTDSRATERLEEVRCLADSDRRLEGLLASRVRKGHAGRSQEQSQCWEMLEVVLHRLAQGGGALDPLFTQLRFAPGPQALEHG